MGRGNGPGEVQLPGDLLPVDGPQTLEDTQDIHHHLLGVRFLGIGDTHFKIVYHKKGMLQSSVTHSSIKHLKVDQKSAGTTLLH